MEFAARAGETGAQESDGWRCVDSWIEMSEADLLSGDGREYQFLIFEDFAEGRLVLLDRALVGEDGLLILHDCDLVGKDRFLVF